MVSLQRLLLAVLIRKYLQRSGNQSFVSAAVTQTPEGELANEQAQIPDVSGCSMIAAAAPNSRVDRMLALMAAGLHGVREAIAATAVADGDPYRTLRSMPRVNSSPTQNRGVAKANQALVRALRV
jgi:hypothetical protein